MLALMNTSKPAFLEIDNDKFKTIMKISNEDSIEQKNDRSGKDEDASKTLQLLRIKGFPRLLPEGENFIVNCIEILFRVKIFYPKSLRTHASVLTIGKNVFLNVILYFNFYLCKLSNINNVKTMDIEIYVQNH